jgi:hypothetical protein
LKTIKRHLRPNLPLAGALAFLMLAPCLARAVSIGDVALQSSLGEPLRAQVELALDKGEHVDDTCLSLAQPDPREEDARNYLTKAKLTLVTEGERSYIAINTSQSLNDAYVKLRLQVKCLGVGTDIRTLTLLPDLDILTAKTEAASAAPAPAVASVVSVQELAPAPVQPQPSVQGKPAQPPSRRTHKPSHRLSHKPSHRAAHTAEGQRSSGPASFRLKLSGNPIDESRIGKISPEERNQLLARQKFLDTDDQTASFLALQQQVKDLQAALAEIKLKLAPLNAVSPPSQATPATGTQGAAQTPAAKPPVAAKPPAAPQNELPDEMFEALGLVLAILALWLGWRYYTKAKSRAKIAEPAYPEPLPAKSALNFSNKQAPAPHVPTPPPPANQPSQIVFEAPKASAPAVAEVAATHKDDAEIPEDELLMEEASLYVTHGRPVKAIEVLQQVIKNNPARIEAWSFLLSIYSSLAKVSEFAETAQAFLEHHKNHPSWSSIQALGRTLDGKNPLYHDSGDGAAAKPPMEARRPIGDILIEMGVLSKQDLQRCLDNFNLKIHGRFGGYLVARKVITLAQLDEALLLQQGAVEHPHEQQQTAAPAAAAPDTPPQIKGMEDFLADFDLNKNDSAGAPTAAPAAGQAATATIAEQPATISKKDIPPVTLDFELPLFNLPETASKPTSNNPADKKTDTA